MADDAFDPFASVLRVAEAAHKFDARAAEVLALHFALEREVESALQKLVVRPERIKKLGFANQVKVLEAIWPGPDDKAEALFLILNSFNELRNKFAHNDLVGIETCHSNLIAAYRAIDPAANDPISYALVAQGACLLLGGGPLPGELRLLAKGMKEVISTFAKMFGFSGTTKQ